MRIAKLLLAVLAFVALPAAAQHDQYHLWDRFEGSVDTRREILTEQVLRSNEAYFFYLFNNGRPAPEHANILLDNAGLEYWFTVVKFSNGDIKVAFTDGAYGRAFTADEFCVSGDFGILMPFPQTKHAWERKKPKALFVKQILSLEYAFYPYNSKTMLVSHDGRPACVEPPVGVSVEYVHTYLITPEMSAIIRRWLWEKWSDATHLADEAL